MSAQGESSSNRYATAGERDVLCGRSKKSYNHVGNRLFREIVAESMEDYTNASSRIAKSEVVSAIVAKVLATGGRFLKWDSKAGGVWRELNRHEQIEKAGHAIRDATITDESKQRRASNRRMKRQHSNSSTGAFSGRRASGRAAMNAKPDTQESSRSSSPTPSSSSDCDSVSVSASLSSSSSESESDCGNMNDYDTIFGGEDTFLAYIDQVLGPVQEEFSLFQ